MPYLYSTPRLRLNAGDQQPKELAQEEPYYLLHYSMKVETSEDEHPKLPRCVSQNARLAKEDKTITQAVNTPMTTE